MIAGLTLVRNWVNTTGEYILDRSVLEAAHAQLAAGTIDSIGAYLQAFKGTFYGTVNLVALLLQFFFVSRLMKHLGVRMALFVLPLLALGGYMAMAVATSFAVIAVAKVAENGMDYSLQNTALHTLFLWPSREAKYKAKAVIDTCVWRGGDLLAAAVIFAGTHWFAFRTRDFVLVNVALLTVWAGVVLALGRAHARTEAAALRAASEPPPATAEVGLVFAE